MSHSDTTFDQKLRPYQQCDGQASETDHVAPTNELNEMMEPKQSVPLCDDEISTTLSTLCSLPSNREMSFYRDHSPISVDTLDQSDSGSASTAASLTSGLTPMSMSRRTSEYADSTQSDRSAADRKCTSLSLSEQLISRHLIQKCSSNPTIHFDAAAITKSNGKIIAISCNPLESGIHEWTLDILQCDVEIAEVGVCSVSDIEGIKIHDDGVTETVALGARGIYGNELATGKTSRVCRLIYLLSLNHVIEHWFHLIQGPYGTRHIMKVENEDVSRIYGRVIILDGRPRIRSKW